MSGSTSNPNDFIGYPNQLFQVCAITLSWLQNQITGANNVAAIASQVQVGYETVQNAQRLIAAYQVVNAWTTELMLLQEVQVLPLGLTDDQQALFVNRINCLEAAIPALQALLPSTNILAVIPTLENGQPAIAYPGLLEFYMSFTFEEPPSDFITATDMVAALSQAVINWNVIASSVTAALTQFGLTQGYDEVARIVSSLTQMYNNVLTITSPPNNLTFADPNGTIALLWNQVVTVPSMLLSASTIYSAPSTLLNQQCGLIRYVLGVSLNALALYSMALRQPLYGKANLATLQANDSLLDIAARSTGNFENWRTIAQLNGLTAPWVGEENSQPGAKLLIPTATGQPQIGLPIPSYDINVLGADWFFGPLKQEMPVWAGDIPLISGPDNLSTALTRRIMTVLNDLIYHSNYGSRIPPEVGDIQDESTAALITAFGTSALLSDPRVQAVTDAKTIINGNGPSSDAFQASVQPVGSSGQNGVTVNAVLAPTP